MAFQKAQPKQAYLKTALYGPPGSGKTFTALLLAEGLAGLTGKRIAFIDTEHGTDFYAQAVATRSVHPEAFDFDAIYTRSITEILHELKNLDVSKYGVLVIDSITHVWEACQLAYQGAHTKIGTIPFRAWGQIKKPYKDLIAFLLSAPMHVFICGRQANEFAEDDDTGELKRVGVKMRAEGETPYEPHVLLRMEAVKVKGKKTPVVTAHVEKDRTGVLAGQTLPNPGFEVLAKPLLGLLGGSQAYVPTDEEVGAKDAEALAEKEMERAEKSRLIRDTFLAKFIAAETVKEVEAVSKQITAEVKRDLLPADMATLREKYQQAKRHLSREMAYSDQ